MEWIQKTQQKQRELIFSFIVDLEPPLKLNIDLFRPPNSTPFIFSIVKHYADRFHLVDFINDKVRWDKTQWQVSPGNLALGLIYLMFMTEDCRIPLYKVSERLKDLDLNLLFEDTIHPEDFTIDAYETLLDRLHEAGCQDIFTTIALQVYQLFPLPRSYTHHGDTTTHMLYGFTRSVRRRRTMHSHPPMGKRKLTDRT